MSIQDRWGALWRERNRVDGEVQYVMWHECQPLLFRTRQQARDWIQEHYGYIAHRPDLRAEPFGWRTPRAIRVRVSIEPVTTDAGGEA